MLIAYELLLVALPFNSSCPRQRIPDVTLGFWLLGQSHSTPACGGHLLVRDLAAAKSRLELLRSWTPFNVELRTSLFRRDTYKDASGSKPRNRPALTARIEQCGHFSMSFWTKPVNPRWLVNVNDD